MRRWCEGAGALLAVLAGPALAQDNPFAGSWCTGNGEIMYVEPGSIGFNEHTVCDLPADLPESGALVADLACANIYLNGDEVVRAFERTVALHAEPTADGLMVRLDDEQPALWQRCDN